MRIKKQIIKIIVLSFILSSFLYVASFQAVYADGATWYVSTNGNDANTGSSTSPFLTLNQALKKVGPGDTVYVAVGTYPTSSDTMIHGTASSRITIIGEGPNTVISGRLTIKHSYYTWKNLKFTTNYVALRDSGASYNVFENNEFTGATQGLYMNSAETNDGTTGPSFNFITNNEFYSPIGSGMVVLLGHDNTVSNNIFRDGGGWDALRVWGLNQTISDNQFLRINSDQEATGGNHADIIQTFKSSNNMAGKNIIFERNFIKDSTAQFGNLAGSLEADLKDWTFRNNVFINSRIQLNNYLPYVKIYNNTVYGTPAAFTIGFRFAASETEGYANYGEVYNNIFIGDGGFYSFHSSTVGSVADHNIISNLDGSAKDAFQEGGNGISGGFNPTNLFLNLGNLDLRLKLGSIAIDAGKNITTFNNDIVGVTRPQGLGWDIGAYEFVQTGGTTPLSGDINLDHIVNSIDWSIMNSKWQTSDSSADLNKDGLVTVSDFSILNGNWLKTW